MRSILRPTGRLRQFDISLEHVVAAEYEPPVFRVHVFDRQQRRLEQLAAIATFEEQQECFMSFFEQLTVGQALRTVVEEHQVAVVVEGARLELPSPSGR